MGSVYQCFWSKHLVEFQSSHNYTDSLLLYWPAFVDAITLN